MKQLRDEIPVAPIRRHLQEWIDRHGFDANREAAKRDGDFMSPLRIATEKLWPGGNWKNHSRSLHRILNDDFQHIGFDLADRILCQVLERPQLWRSDPELAEAYRRADFRTLDATRPTCSKVEAHIAKTVVEAFRTTGSINGAVRETGIAFNRTSSIIKAAA